MLIKTKIVIEDIISHGKIVPRSAAALSYYLTLSFFPFLICLNWIVGLFSTDIHQIAALANGIIPKSTLDIIDKYIEYISNSQSSALLIAGVTMFVTSLSAAFRAILGTLEEINGKKRNKSIWYYALGFACSALFLFGTYICLLLSVTGKTILVFINSLLNISIWFDGTLPFIILFAYLFFVLTGLYKLALPKGFPVKKVWKGSLLSAVGVVVLSIIFSSFLQYSTKYSLVYGSLASLMVLMIWMFTCGMVIISGAVLNHGLNMIDE